MVCVQIFCYVSKPAFWCKLTASAIKIYLIKSFWNALQTEEPIEIRDNSKQRITAPQNRVDGCIREAGMLVRISRNSVISCLSRLWRVQRHVQL